MATTYYPDNASSDLNTNTVTAPAASKKLVQTAAGSATALTITIPGSASGVECFFISEPADPSTSGGTGSQNYTAKVNVTTANANFTNGGLLVARINSAGVQQASGALAAAGTIFQTTGVKTQGPTALNLGTFASGDRFTFRIQTNNAAMSAQSIIIEIGLASGNEEVLAPWTIAPPPPATIPDILMAPLTHY